MALAPAAGCVYIGFAFCVSTISWRVAYIYCPKKEQWESHQGRVRELGWFGRFLRFWRSIITNAAKVGVSERL